MIADKGHFRPLFYPVFHHTATFQRQFHDQAGERTEATAVAARLRRQDAVEFLECLCKAVRAFIAIFQRDVDHLRAAGGQFRAGKRQPAVANVLPKRVSAQDAEHALKMVARCIALRRDLGIIDRLRKVRLDVVDGALQSGGPVRTIPSLSAHIVSEGGELCPIFPAHCRRGARSAPRAAARWARDCAFRASPHFAPGRCPGCW